MNETKNLSHLGVRSVIRQRKLGIMPVLDDDKYMVVSERERPRKRNE